ncbi:hypothetical protein pEaSNUABM11_00067 [Erwinia phage pEa_SNUABM_11]|nr:hypothetical protein pEaSNUABM11_00067 [Erwinia phage pEa_SNUABM_11]
MNFIQRKLARESVESTDPNAIDGISNVEPAEENLDVQLGELASIDGELDALDGDQETLATDTDRTEAAVDQAAESVENGEEMPEEAIAAAEVAQESIRRRWGIDVPKLARESYRRGRGMTVAAQEGWKETLKDLWRRFIDFCKTVIDKIKDAKLKYLNVGKTAQGRAKKFQAAIKALGKKNKEEISGGFISKLSIEGSFSLEQSISAAKDVTGGKAKSAITHLQGQAHAAETVVTKATKADAAVATSGFYDTVELFGTAAKKMKNLPQFENEEAQRLYALPGNAYIQSGKKAVNGVDFTAVGFLSTGDSSEAKNVPTPSVQQLSSAAGSLDAIGKGFETVLKDFRSYDDEIGKLRTAAESAAKAIDSAADNAEHKTLSAARSAADQAVRNYQTLHRAVSFVANTVISGLNGYIGAGIGAYAKG